MINRNRVDTYQINIHSIFIGKHTLSLSLCYSSSSATNKLKPIIKIIIKPPEVGKLSNDYHNVK